MSTTERAGLAKQTKQFLALRTKRDKAKARHDALTKELEECEEKLIERFTEDGVKGIKVGRYNVSLRYWIWASAAQGMERLCAALKRQGLAALVKKQVNPRTLTAWVRELDQTPDGMPLLPSKLKPYIQVAQKSGLSVHTY